MMIIIMMMMIIQGLRLKSDIYLYTLVHNRYKLSSLLAIISVLLVQWLENLAWHSKVVRLIPLMAQKFTTVNTLIVCSITYINTILPLHTCRDD